MQIDYIIYIHKMSNRYEAPRRTMPDAGRPTHMVTHDPDRPTVPVAAEPKLAVKLTTTNRPLPEGSLEAAVTVRLDAGYEREVRATEIYPLVKKPLTPVFETRVGGHRTLGGGTSREALRRAKHHQARN